MSGGPRVKLMNNADSEVRSVLGPAGNKSRSVELRKPVEKPVKNNKPETEESKGKKFEGADVLHESRSPVAVSKKCGAVTSILKQQQDHRTLLMRPNLSLNASCSSDASTDSSQSRASTGKLSRGSVTPRGGRRKQCSPKVVKSEKVGKVVGEVESLSPVSNPGDGLVIKKKCAWVTPNTGMCNSLMLNFVCCVCTVIEFYDKAKTLLKWCSWSATTYPTEQSGTGEGRVYAEVVSERT